MADGKFPELEPVDLDATRQAAHAYARVAGAWAKARRRKRKHWWHASLRPSLYGLTTGVIYGPTDFEIELDLASSRIHVRTCSSSFSERLTGQSSAQLAASINAALQVAGVSGGVAPDTDFVTKDSYSNYSADQANILHRAIGSVAAALEDFRAGIREEKSPVQVWPHHFDVSMIWLPGAKVAGQDPANEEYSDKQMNFGFAFGDDSVPEPYFYVTAYPLPDALPQVTLPSGTTWQSEGFNGAVLLYKDLIATSDPHAYLQDLWSTLLTAGREYLRADDEEG
ncbi:MAG: DUF5996 family protein [Gammaproteobacteria bacterium]|jgi:hypothetical protein|nr:DUF5996 family protein [Gammaproteobacteria bacterium]MDH3983258.1 DUF5996 family protein [Gammaproteobacteria bacterium]NCF59904.1 hypothetical protein [Gammaproteobacteria bacterium]